MARPRLAPLAPRLEYCFHNILPIITYSSEFECQIQTGPLTTENTTFIAPDPLFLNSYLTTSTCKGRSVHCRLLSFPLAGLRSLFPLIPSILAGKETQSRIPALWPRHKTRSTEAPWLIATMWAREPGSRTPQKDGSPRRCSRRRWTGTQSSWSLN